MSPDPWARLYRKDTIYRGLGDELLVIAAIIHRAQQLAAALESSAAHQGIRRLRLTEIQQAKDEFRALVDDLQVGALSRVSWKGQREQKDDTNDDGPGGPGVGLGGAGR